jgi:hypothetical protein
MIRKDRCEKCKFGDVADHLTKENKLVCHRYPPHATVSADRSIHTQFPIVLGHWWCGEFKAKGR